MESRLLLAADLTAAVVPDPVIDPILHLPGSIAGRVVASVDLGEGQSLDSGVSGVRLELLSAAGEILAEAITDDAGSYEFPALEPGVYSVRELQPAGFLDGLSQVGSGNGVIESNLITQIIVQSGDQLIGYDFAEIPAPAIAAFDPVSTPVFVGPMISPTITWSRPVEIAIPPRSEQVANTPPSLPPLVMRAADPIFGGSSDVPREKEMATDAFFSDDDGEVEAIGARITKSDQPAEEAEEADDSKRVAASRLRQAARDQAFESNEEPEAIEAPDVDPQQPHVRIARKPAA
jgi:hypothetical protein